MWEEKIWQDVWNKETKINEWMNDGSKHQELFFSSLTSLLGWLFQAKQFRQPLLLQRCTCMYICITDDWVLERWNMQVESKHAKLSPTRSDLAYHCLLSSTYKVSVSRKRVMSCRDNFLMNWRPGRGPSNRQNTFATSFKKAASQKKTPHLALKVTHEHLQACVYK